MTPASRAAEELSAAFRGAGVSVQPAGSHFLPVVVRPATSGLDAFGWVAANRPALDTVLRQVGAILFRGFDTGTISSRHTISLRAETVTFPWERGDVLVLDNMLVAHGRRPYTGPRRVLVSMGNAYLETRARLPSLLRAPAQPAAVARRL